MLHDQAVLECCKPRWRVHQDLRKCAAGPAVGTLVAFSLKDSKSKGCAVLRFKVLVINIRI